ncbi:P-loop containing nucleoside triphosphate hydrolase protein [Apiospora aurea]|uniref:P-loop containing nucleoside triphosphate hydrolase protein n=1 Tax=Apiospora aurea TaxID=335848 RepID=A0ABR1PTD1_9PEZI
MEPIGFALGIASLFTTCIDCFELVQSGRYLGQEYHLLETKFVNQRIRLVAWGKACGFTDPNGYDRRIDENKEVRDAIEASLLHLIGLLQDGDKLTRKYGLRRAGAETQAVGPGPSSLILHSSHTWPLQLGQSAVASLAQKLARFRERTRSTQQQANLWAKASWAVKDKDKFADLVQHLRDLVEDLEGLTAGLDLAHRQRELIRQEVEFIREIPVLESIEEARVGRLDPVSDAASLRLWSVRDRFSFSRGTSSRSQPSFAAGGHRPRNGSSLRAGEVSRENNAIVYSLAEERPEISDEDWEALSRGPSLSASPSPGLDDDSSSAYYQVLHRVHCEFCSPAIYLDVPGYGTQCSTTNQWMVLDEYHPLHEPKTLHLCGKRLIMDLDTYLGQNRQLRFLVFQEYQCRHEVEGLATSTATTPETVANGQTIYLVSEEVCVAMRRLASRATGMSLPYFEPQAELQYPFYWFYHSRRALENEFSHLEEPTTMALAKELVDFINDSTSEEYSKADELLARRVVSWNTLKYLYAPDDIVVQKHADGFRRSQAYRIIDGQWTEATDITDDVTLKVYYVACQDHLVPLQRMLKIAKGGFENVDAEVAIKDLPIVPLRYDAHITWTALVDRGKRLIGSADNQLDFRYRWVCYSGTEVDSTVWQVSNAHQSSPNFGARVDIRELQDDLRLIIDPSLYWKHNRQNDCSTEDGQPARLPRRPRHNITPDHFLVPGELTPRDLPLLEPTVYGFDLRTHEWRHLYVAGLREVEWNSNAFDDLLLDEKEKALLLGSVQSATQDTDSARGEVNTTAITTSSQYKRTSGGGGGGGSVYLFHGGPGTGKTFATNCISERTRKPLYHMTPFATGVSAEAVQRNMDATLALAQRWDCMLVLEDADATANGGNGSTGGGSGGSHIQHEVPRRAMTMALLKLLDGFGGIVVLNSSRVDVLDDALFSRVHLAIYFPELDVAARRRIWHDAFSAASTHASDSTLTGSTGTASNSDEDADDKCSGEGGGEGAAVAVAVTTAASEVDPYLLSPEAEQKLATTELNGREIRNVVAQSLRIARFQGRYCGSSWSSPCYTKQSSCRSTGRALSMERRRQCLPPTRVVMAPKK